MRLAGVFLVADTRYDTLDDVTGEIQGVADAVAFERKELSDIAGKAGATSATRTYLVRVMAREMMLLYDTPLYSVIAESIALILGEEPIDTNHVMKLVKSNQHFTDPTIF